MIRSITSSEVASLCRATTAELEEGLLRIRGADAQVRVALMGRTMAGKSTLFEALTGGDGSRIGEGAQRTTRETSERPIQALPGVVLVDTPGVGAKDGHEDRLLAFEAMLGCDVVLWVAANDSTQRETAEALVSIADVGKPLIVAMNCRQGIGTEAKRRRLLRDPQRPFRDLEGHVARLQAFLEPLGVRPGAVVAVHALAAFEGAKGDPELLSVSGLESLRSAVKDDVDAVGPQRQALTVADACRGPLSDAVESFRRVADELHDLSQLKVRAAAEYLVRMTRALASAQAEGALLVETRIAAGRDWHLRADLDGDLNKQMHEHHGQVAKAVESALEEADQDMCEALTDEQGLFADDWTLPPLRDQQHVAFDDAGAWGNRAAKLATRASFGLATALIVMSNPVGWVTAAVALGGILVDRTVVQPATKKGGWIDRVLPSRQQKVLLLREQVSAANRESLDQIRHSALEALEHRRQEYLKLVEANHRAQEAEAEGRLATASASAASALNLQSLVRQLDAETAGAVLALAGRGRGSAAVRECVRQPGRAMAVGMEGPAADEEALFPSTVPEPLHPFPAEAPVPSARRALHVIAAVYPPPYHAVLRGACLTVALEADDWPGRRERVQQLATGASGLQVMLHELAAHPSRG
ncbi:GTPase domain-containing protein [Pedococcus ginsenosidimutans]|uniref:GTPase domain-containing protein n=1 Tax=Pedococcus ginsenosidimutans TaxID=490570 RepID=UPI0031F04888